LEHLPWDGDLSHLESDIAAVAHHLGADHDLSHSGWIVLQKSKVAGLRIFAKNPKREAIADSSNLNRATEVAYEFNVP